MRHWKLRNAVVPMALTVNPAGAGIGQLKCSAPVDVRSLIRDLNNARPDVDRSRPSRTGRAHGARHRCLSGSTGRLKNVLLTWNAVHCCGPAMKAKVDD